MPLHIQVLNATQQERLEHTGGPLEFGRGPQGETPRFVIDDPCVSRDQLRVWELSEGRIRIENLSERTVIAVVGGEEVRSAQTRELALPLQLQVGQTKLVFVYAALPTPSVRPVSAVPRDGGTAIPATKPSQTAALPRTTRPDEAVLEGLVGIAPAVRRSRRERQAVQLPPGPAVDCLTKWLETILELQQVAAGSSEFYGRLAQTLIDLIGLDLGLVLLRQGKDWEIVGSAVADDQTSVCYSRTLLNHVVGERRTFYQDLNQLQSNATSLANIEAAVVSPIFGLQDNVVGALYGSRTPSGLVSRGPISPLEAQLVQLLAAAASTNLARAAAVRTRVQFEQFFSAELAQELERDPDLLEGRSEEITVLVSDLRGFTSLSQRLGAQKTCRMVRDMMERLSERIVEHGGVIVDYAGDGILAMWNAPAKQPDHVARACRAALAMLGEIPGLNERWVAEGAGQLTLGIGINTGSAQVGNTGSSRKFKYGPHGHTVNLASRVQDATKKFGLPALITESVRQPLPPEFQTRRLGRVCMPGVDQPVTLYELYGDAAPEAWQAQRDVYERALDLYEAGHWAAACRTLMPLLSGTQYDGAILKLMRRAWECLESRPAAFEPVIEITTK
ncbi:MAG: adenylate/guanylate cyclase domain-containing protein [Planctomycetota bacterium]|nr:adenylate/guanylate cyclase domain-containing protein [Planctomycetota bacterium]